MLVKFETCGGTRRKNGPENYSPRVVAVASVATMSIGATQLVSSTPALAALGNCAYPYVCVYSSNGTKVGQYRDITANFQLFSRTDVTQAKNTRNDDVAYFTYQNGQTSCVENNRESTNLLVGVYGYVRGIRISDSDTCYG